MASVNNNETSPGDGGALGADEKPRLTEEEKKQNHIASGTQFFSPPVRSEGHAY